MRKITFTNETNGNAVSFSTDDSTMFLEDFDGNTCPSTAVTYKPAEYDGQRFISANLNARTITFTVNFTATSDGKHSYSGAAEKWDEIQAVFVPGQYGTLVWADGTNSRQIRCRTEGTPCPALKCRPSLFTATFSLVADKPLWYDTVANTIEITGSYTVYTINNDCGIAVPFVLDVDLYAPFIYSNTAETGLAFSSECSSGVTVDTDECTVYCGDELVNNLLTASSEFFKILPGANVIQVLPGIGSGGGTGTLTWYKAYMGVL